MTAPVATERVDPSANGNKLNDGHSTRITIAKNPDIEFWEKSVTPPGVDGGDAIETTTMFNNDWRTMKPRRLKTLTDVEVTGAYDPDVYDQIVAVINIETTITVRFSDDSTLAFFGYVKTFEPQSVEEGAQPEANITIVPTNWDPVAGSEEGPTLVETAGTV